MSMYFIGCGYEPDTNYDLFVVADDIPTAKRLWEEHYGLAGMEPALAATIWKLSYHAHGPNAVIPWEKLERTDL